MEDSDLPALIEDLGLPGIVDVHAHFMPPQILAKVWAYFDSAGPLLGRPWPIAYRTSDDDRVARLRSMGVRRFSALSYAHRPGVAGFMNDWTRDFAERTPDALWSATFYPEPDAATYVPQLVADGVEIFKVHVQVGDFAPNDPLLEPVWATLAESGTPVVLHAGSGPAPGRHTGPAGVADVLSRHPDLALVIAHLGMPEMDEFLDLAERHDNVRLDTTMAFVDFWGQPVPDGVPQRLLDLQERILFGTDFPNIPYAYAHQVEVLQRLALGDDWMRSVLWHNGAELFGVDA
ncbi:amidohydrolase [Aeromicrobium chenweiae]|uniref:Amidohydrolase n=1 Tax=Aeromicrobium chenweiae TaxID=2079793 RepID=A0A2S0WRT8_9ACTN|nr:amidohydrolase family protein [Aeromicrobium chenweiae]AWB94039.1 amidohydrolase [Aeromicrobium chenweiae]TGN33034.1 amidohydrolase [Aeromicrobium chenweiae]